MGPSNFALARRHSSFLEQIEGLIVEQLILSQARLLMETPTDVNWQGSMVSPSFFLSSAGYSILRKGVSLLHVTI